MAITTCGWLLVTFLTPPTIKKRYANSFAELALVIRDGVSSRLFRGKTKRNLLLKRAPIINRNSSYMKKETDAGMRPFFVDEIVLFDDGGNLDDSDLLEDKAPLCFVEDSEIFFVHFNETRVSERSGTVYRQFARPRFPFVFAELYG